MGTVEVTFSTDSELGPLFESGAFPSHMSHVESVLRPPQNARILATTALDPNSVLEFGPRQWGVQFHPEFDRDIMCGYVEVRREILSGEGLDPDAMVADAKETDSITRVLLRFAQLVGQD
jgi:GMP synthase (glutamine-hydrolysing)